jgi:hypothetical protein
MLSSCLYFQGLIIKMLLILIPCLLASSVLAANEEQCQVGDITFTGFDINQVSQMFINFKKTLGIM